MIKLEISATNIDLTDALRIHVEKYAQHLTKHLGKLANDAAFLHVILSTDHPHNDHAHKAEGVLTITHKKLCAAKLNKDLYTAITDMAHTLERQISDYKSQLEKH